MDESKQESESLREEMLARLEAMRGWPIRADVREAMVRIPRHVFVPDAALSDAYGLGAVVTHRDEQNVATSSASAPGTVARMLEQAEVQPGHRVLEVGSGTGYNAALLAHLAGPSGRVVTIEFDPEVADAARTHLAAYGASTVRVITGDGTLGSAEESPFDRILVTAGAWDVAPAWVEQLAPGGRIVLPLRLRGLTRVVAFERDGNGLRSVSVAEDGFIPMKGVGAMPEKNVPLGVGPDLVLRIDDDQRVDASLLRALDEPAGLVWTEVEAPWAYTPEHDFWVATVPGFCRVFLDDAAVATGRVPRGKDPWGAWGAFDGGSLAYLAARQVDGTDEMPMLQVGAAGFGPDGARLARQLADRVTAWARDTAGSITVSIQALPASEAVTDVDALLVVEKTDHVFVVNASRLPAVHG